MPRIGLTIQQKELLKTKLGDDDLAIAIVDMVYTGVNTNGVDDTTAAYVAKMDCYESKKGDTTWFLTVPNLHAF